MARQITVLEQNLGDQGTRSVRVVFWYPVVGAGRPVPKPGFVSAAVNPTTPITTQEQSDLELGNTLEEVLTISFPTAYTTAQMKAFLQARYSDKASAVAAAPASRAFFGVTFDGAAWSA